MSTPRDLVGWSVHAQQTAWFQAWLRGVRSGDTRLVGLAQRELRALGVQVHAISTEVRP